MSAIQSVKNFVNSINNSANSFKNWAKTSEGKVSLAVFGVVAGIGTVVVGLHAVDKLGVRQGWWEPVPAGYNPNHRPRHGGDGTFNNYGRD